MKNILDIYEEYKIPAMLQMHQLRVAALALCVSKNYREKLDEELIIKGCLLHDMGNIVKSDLNIFPELVLPEGLEYWQKIKNEFIKKYGEIDHLATLMILKEININEKFFDFTKSLVEYMLENIVNPQIELVIAKYADIRVGPHGILSIKDRMEDFRRRYKGKFSDIYVDNTISVFTEAERNIFTKCNIKPEDITDESINVYIEELKNVKV